MNRSRVPGWILVLVFTLLSGSSRGEQAVTPSITPAGTRILTPPSEEGPQPRSLLKYVVQKGDNLWIISKKIFGEGSRCADLFKASAPLSDKPQSILHPGQALEFPPEAEGYRILSWEKKTGSAAFSPRRLTLSAAFKGRIWVVGGDDRDASGKERYINDVWSSKDGVEWEQATVSTGFPTYGGTLLSFHGKLWIITGKEVDHQGTRNSAMEEIWSSTDGVQWGSEANLSNTPYTGFTNGKGVVFKDEMWVFGSDVIGSAPWGAVWHSKDGIHWVNVPPIPLRARDDFGLAVHDGRIWVVGGYMGQPLSDVWSSLDGQSWVEATSQAPFGRLNGMGCVSFDHFLWVLGGWKEKPLGDCSDAWYSADGVDWKRAGGMPSFAQRCQFTSLLYGGRMWLIGGLGAGGFLNDVWSFPR